MDDSVSTLSVGATEPGNSRSTAVQEITYPSSTVSYTDQTAIFGDGTSAVVDSNDQNTIINLSSTVSESQNSLSIVDVVHESTMTQSSSQFSDNADKTTTTN
jgi:hypothetical protein